MILIYNDLGVSTNCLHALIDFVSTHFKHKKYKLTNSQLLMADLLVADVLIMPGGEDRFYQQKLKGAKNAAIKNFVMDGGFYIGICAGAYYGSEQIKFVGSDYKITQERELAFFSGNAIGSIPALTQGVYFSEASASKAVVALSHGAKHYYHGGCYFELADEKGINILFYEAINKPAIIDAKCGKGGYLLSGVHFEITKARYQQFTLKNPDINKEVSILNALSADDDMYLINIINKYTRHT